MVDKKASKALKFLQEAEAFAKERAIQVHESEFNTHIQVGYVRWAFTLAFYYLLREDIESKNLFDFSMREICSLGGDTDTHCCIVGGILGAVLGLNNLP